MPLLVHDLPIDVCGRDGLIVRVEFNFTRGYPESRPDYWCGGEPAVPDSSEVVKVQILIGGELIDPPLALAKWLAALAEEDFQSELCDIATWKIGE